MTVSQSVPAWKPPDAPGSAGTIDMSSGRVRGPRDAAELTMWRIWREHFGVVQLPLDSDYFDLGGTSIEVIRLLSRIREQTSVALPLEAILEAPTVATMAAMIRTDTQNTASRSSSLLTIRNGARRPALICLHPIGGTVLWYRHLAYALDEGIPVIGIQARGLDPSKEADRDIPSMVAHYVTETLAAHRPEEIILVGYSFGGLVAYEMACQLARIGTLPAGVLLLDTSVTRQHSDPPSRARLLWSLVGHALGLDADIEALAAMEPAERTESLLRLAIAQGKLPPGFGASRLTRLIDIYPVNSDAERAYRPPAYPGRIDLICPRDGRTDEESLGIWGEVSKGGLRVHEVNGDHFNLVAEHNVGAVADVIHRIWYEATRETGAR